MHGEAGREVPGYITWPSITRDAQVVANRYDDPEPGLLVPGDFEAEFLVPPYFLSPAEYWATVCGYSVETGEWTEGTDRLRFVVVDEWSKDYDTMSMGIVNPRGPGRRVRRQLQQERGETEVFLEGSQRADLTSA